MYKTTRQGKQEMENLTAVNQLELTDIYRIFHLTTLYKYTLFSSAHGTFPG